jgi:hypothetical protein
MNSVIEKKSKTERDVPIIKVYKQGAFLPPRDDFDSVVKYVSFQTNSMLQRYYEHFKTIMYICI